MKRQVSGRILRGDQAGREVRHGRAEGDKKKHGEMWDAERNSFVWDEALQQNSGEERRDGERQLGMIFAHSLLKYR